MYTKSVYFLISKQFDKSIDDRLPKNKWHYVDKKIDIFILLR